MFSTRSPCVGSDLWNCDHAAVGGDYGDGVLRLPVALDGALTAIQRASGRVQSGIRCCSGVDGTMPK